MKENLTNIIGEMFRIIKESRTLKNKLIVQIATISGTLATVSNWHTSVKIARRSGYDACAIKYVRNKEGNLNTSDNYHPIGRIG